MADVAASFGADKAGDVDIGVEVDSAADLGTGV